MVESTPAVDRAAVSRGRTAPPLWAVAFVACAGQFLIILDVSVMNVALPPVRADLGMSASALQWVVNAYSITFAGLQLLGGRAGDLFGRKRVFLFGLAVFTLASLGGGLAQEPWQLVVARAAQGFGAAVLSPSTLTLVTSAVPEGPARSRAIGTWVAVGAGGGASGGLIGGVLTDALSWRWVLLVNVPIGALVFLAGLHWLAESRGVRRRLDVPGAALVTGGLAALAYGIVQTERAGWGAWQALAPMSGGLGLLALFAYVESRAAAPLVPLGLFRIRAIAGANTAMFAVGAAMFGSWYFLTLQMQNVLGYTPVEAGLAFLPLSLVIVVASKLGPRLMAVLGTRRTALAGCAVSLAGYVWQSVALTPDGGYAVHLLGPGLLMMFGAGVLTTPLVNAATSGVPAGDAGVVSGVCNTSRMMGGSVGLAVLATVAAATTGAHETPAALTDGYATAFRTSAWMLAGTLVLMWLVLPRDRRAGAADSVSAVSAP
ncbi:MFS transporter [Streptomyces sp. NPDC051940]|uniref:MFS transporter n=1 Tax=Streptomyces sp. NPDC051940 TaxID=3155675 RepID=UPI0034362FC5